MSSQNSSSLVRLRAGLLGGPLFVASLLIFGSLEPGFSHFHQAVSELGAWGVRWSLCFDFFGLFLPGLLAFGVAWELRRMLRQAGARARSATGLMIWATMIALTAVPADFERKFDSPWTWVHAFFVLGNALVFFAVIPGCAMSLRILGASKAATMTFVLLGYLPLAEIPLYALLPNTPGIVQRLMILTTLLAVTWLSWVLLRLRRNQRCQERMALSNCLLRAD